MQAKFVADLRACESVLTKYAEEIESDGGQQDLGIPEGERSLQNCVRCWRNCLHMVVDVANLLGVTSDESMRPITQMARLIPVRRYK